MYDARRLILVPLALAAAGLAPPALAQDRPGEPGQETSAAANQAGEAADEDIVVNGLRLRDPEELPVSVVQPSDFARVTRGMSADAAMFSRCAGLPRQPLLGRILDGRPETGETEKSLHWHLVRNRGCLHHIASVPVPEAPHFGACNPRFVDGSRVAGGLASRDPLVTNFRGYRSVCQAVFDRGFVFENALREFAPDLRLSRSNTFDHATRDRFRAREEVRNSARSSDAAEFFYAAACMVQIRPEYALTLLQAEPGSEAEVRLRAMMISDGAPCVGNASKVRVDPHQFRAFVAEAVYSWAVAVRRTDSLVPAEAAG